MNPGDFYAAFLRNIARRLAAPAPVETLRFAWALPLVLGVLAAALVLLGNATYGPVGDWDSVISLDFVRQINAGDIPSDLHATPPGYAALCWLLHTVFGLPPILAAGWARAVAF